MRTLEIKEDLLDIFRTNFPRIFSYLFDWLYFKQRFSDMRFSDKSSFMPLSRAIRNKTLRWQWKKCGWKMTDCQRSFISVIYLGPKDKAVHKWGGKRLYEIIERKFEFPEEEGKREKFWVNLVREEMRICGLASDEMVQWLVHSI
jgi:hypothetical protein